MKGTIIMMNGVNKLVSFGCTYYPAPKVHKTDIPFEQAQSKDDWVSGYNAAVKKLADFSWLQNQMVFEMSKNGVKPQDFLPDTPYPSVTGSAFPVPNPQQEQNQSADLESPFNA